MGGKSGLGWHGWVGLKLKRELPSVTEGRQLLARRPGRQTRARNSHPVPTRLKPAQLPLAAPLFHHSRHKPLSPFHRGNGCNQHSQTHFSVCGIRNRSTYAIESWALSTEAPGFRLDLHHNCPGCRTGIPYNPKGHVAAGCPLARPGRVIPTPTVQMTFLSVQGPSSSARPPT